MIKKNVIIDVICSLVIIFFSVFFSYYITEVLIYENQSLVKYVNRIRESDNIFNKVIKISNQHSFKIIKMYLESVIDCVVEFDKMPIAEDIKDFFLIIVKNLYSEEIEILNVDIEKNMLILTCKSSEEKENIFDFVRDIKREKYIVEVFINNENNKSENLFKIVIKHS